MNCIYVSRQFLAIVATSILKRGSFIFPLNFLFKKFRTTASLQLEQSRISEENKSAEESSDILNFSGGEDKRKKRKLLQSPEHQSETSEMQQKIHGCEGNDEINGTKLQPHKEEERGRRRKKSDERPTFDREAADPVQTSSVPKEHQTTYDVVDQCVKKSADSHSDLRLGATQDSESAITLVHPEGQDSSAVFKIHPETEVEQNFKENSDGSQVVDSSSSTACQENLQGKERRRLSNENVAGNELQELLQPQAADELLFNSCPFQSGALASSQASKQHSKKRGGRAVQKSEVLQQEKTDQTAPEGNQLSQDSEKLQAKTKGNIQLQEIVRPEPDGNSAVSSGADEQLSAASEEHSGIELERETDTADSAEKRAFKQNEETESAVVIGAQEVPDNDLAFTSVSSEADQHSLASAVVEHSTSEVIIETDAGTEKEKVLEEREVQGSALSTEAQKESADNSTFNFISVKDNEQDWTGVDDENSGTVVKGETGTAGTEGNGVQKTAESTDAQKRLIDDSSFDFISSDADQQDPASATEEPLTKEMIRETGSAGAEEKQVLEASEVRGTAESTEAQKEPTDDSAASFGSPFVGGFDLTDADKEYARTKVKGEMATVDTEKKEVSEESESPEIAKSTETQKELVNKSASNFMTRNISEQDSIGVAEENPGTVVEEETGTAGREENEVHETAESIEAWNEPTDDTASSFSPGDGEALGSAIAGVKYIEMGAVQKEQMPESVLGIEEEGCANKLQEEQVKKKLEEHREEGLDVVNDPLETVSKSKLGNGPNQFCDGDTTVFTGDYSVAKMMDGVSDNNERSGNKGQRIDTSLTQEEVEKESIGPHMESIGITELQHSQAEADGDSSSGSISVRQGEQSLVGHNEVQEDDIFRRREEQIGAGDIQEENITKQVETSQKEVHEVTAQKRESKLEDKESGLDMSPSRFGAAVDEEQTGQFQNVQSGVMEASSITEENKFLAEAASSFAPVTKKLADGDVQSPLTPMEAAVESEDIHVIFLPSSCLIARDFVA